MQIRKLIVSSFKKAIRYDSCADPGIFVRCGGGGGGSRSIWQIKKSLTMFFFILFFSPQLILHKSSGYFQRKLLFAKVSVGVDFFQGGGGSNFIQGGGGTIAFSLIETHITCDFPGG